MIKVGIVGISGYSGKVLLDILLKHPEVCVSYVAAKTTTGPVDAIWPEFKRRTSLICEKYDPRMAVEKADLFFLALPHTESMNSAGHLLAKGKRVIDLSADYRIKKPSLYEKWYHVAHCDRQNLLKAVYGLPEIYRAKIRKAVLIANPGCYPTAALLALAPLVSIHSKVVQDVIVDAKSGASGAGKKVVEGFMFCSVNENFKAYRVLDHQHTPEINEYLSYFAGRKISATFVPHLLPIDSGILETIYVKLSVKISSVALEKLYHKFYKTEPFVRVLDKGQQPEIRNIIRTNFCDIAPLVSKDGKLVVITSAIDNLVKGASGQAVHNMNIMCGFEETTGLL